MKDAVALLIGHGSKLDIQKKMIERLAESVKSRKIFAEVFYAFMNVNKPTIRDAMTDIVRKGYRKVIAIPVFLSEGVHTTEDIPKELGLKNGQREGVVEFDGVEVKILYARTIGYDDRIAEILVERGKEAVENSKEFFR
ncbi:MAG: sirohydrochlorin cobalto/nickelchelatase [Archaeoglobaceae archaeon]|nr:sirohydrochlorin cobalto/nickelchelatase [Archaeoglobaceae archaeon]MDK2876801.1 sirohydrochlorin cobalto/nickelchelatase [Archaeoglobaceae archaeon]